LFIAPGAVRSAEVDIARSKRDHTRSFATDGDPKHPRTHHRGRRRDSIRRRTMGDAIGAVNVFRHNTSKTVPGLIPN